MASALLSSSSTLLIYKFCVIAMFAPTIVLVSTGRLHASAAYTPSAPLYTQNELNYYVHLLLGGQDLAITFLPAVNTSFTANFGSANLFAFNVTKGESLTSDMLGFVRGFTIETSYIMGASRGLEVATVEYDDGVYKGTIQLQGLAVSTSTEVAIVGGTGSFRGARGYLLVSLVSAVEPNQVYYHQIFFM